MPIIPRHLEEPAVTDEEIFQECSERLRIALEAESENRARGIEALQFRDGNQWPDDLYSQRKIDKRPSLTINHTNTFCRRVVNNMRQQRPRIKVHPVGEGAQEQEAEIIEGIIRHIENISNAQVAYDTGGESAVNIGWGYARVITEYVDERSFDQEVKITAVRNTFTGYIDPGATQPDGSDMDWFIFSEKMKRQDYKRDYPDAENTEFIRTGSGDNTADWETKDEIRLAEYFRVQKVKAPLYRMTNGMSMFRDEMKMLKPELGAAQVTIATDANGKEISRPSFKRQIEWFRLNGRKVIDKRVLPGRYIPVVRFEGNVLDLNGKVRRKGMVQDLMDPARMYNYWRTKETEVLALTAASSMVGAAGQFEGHPEWANANQKPYAYLEYEPTYLEQPDGTKTLIPPPQRAMPVQVPAGFVEAAESAAKDLMAVAGMPHEPGEDTPGTVVSGVALHKRQALSDIGHFQYYDNQTQAIAQIGRICLDYIPVIYDQQRMQRIIGEDGVPEMVGINQRDPAINAIKNDLTIGRYDVVMDTGPGYETKRLEGAEAMIDLLKTPLGEPVAKVGADLVVRNMDFAGANDLADRLMPMTPQGLEKAMEGVPKQAKGIVTAMYSHITQLQQALQQAQLEIKYKGSIEQGWMQTDLQKEQIKDSTKQMDTHVKAQTAINVAEINAGAKLLDTHVSGKYEAEARKDELKAAEKAEKGNGASKNG